MAGVFDRAAPTYDAVGVPWFTPIAEGLVAALAPEAGQRALDIGCGRGAALWSLAAAVGAEGSVTGIDLAPAMIELTRADATARGLANVDLQVMDAVSPDLPAGSYDLVASSLVLFFLPEPLEPLRRWRDLVKPGGRLGISTFGDRDDTWVQIDEAFKPYLPPFLLDARTSGSRGPFAADEGVEDLFRSAGLDSVRTAGQEVVSVLRDPEHWVQWSWSHGQRAMWEFVPEADRPKVQAQATAVLETMRGSDGHVELRQRVRYTVGVRAS